MGFFECQDEVLLVEGEEKEEDPRPPILEIPGFDNEVGNDDCGGEAEEGLDENAAGVQGDDDGVKEALSDR